MKWTGIFIILGYLLFFQVLSQTSTDSLETILSTQADPAKGNDSNQSQYLQSEVETENQAEKQKRLKLENDLNEEIRNQNTSLLFVGLVS